MAEEKKSKVIDRYSFIEVPTQHQLMIKDSETDKVYSIDAVILEILNTIKRIEKVV